jgi:hypothetical protein
MKKPILIIISFFILFQKFFFTNLYSQINNVILVKVGDSIVTSVDLRNEIFFNLLINKQEINQENIDRYKDFAVKNLVNRSIKKSEINKFNVTDYNKTDLQEFINNIAKNFNTNQQGLEKIFIQNNLSYSEFIESHKTELLWNTLIFKIYQNQININIIDVDNEIQKIKENKNVEELKKIRSSILNKKKQEKLSLFSRSHLLNLENSIIVKFQ